MGNRCTQKLLVFLGRLEKDMILDLFRRKNIRETFKCKLMNMSNGRVISFEITW